MTGSREPTTTQDQKKRGHYIQQRRLGVGNIGDIIERSVKILDLYDWIERTYRHTGSKEKRSVYTAEAP